ncbi:TSUP family transporter [Oricola thermophila]|uniref:Probable membrane transporter protein n=1 Tax=Oricola thermophila TaxID=2742145 RepID=A0A6N1V9J4_9HYPH|nr:TSUP family transporter [Oricola thermophila]QKV17398.1 TSUP family transporter [Oricola thermophila]
MFELAPDIVALLVIAAFAAGFVDSIAGGGGLITIPALLLAGAPPVTALGTNKLQGMFGAASATWSYARNGHVRLAQQILPAVLAFAGSILGALTATILPGEIFGAVLPLLLVAIAAYFLLRPGLDDIDRAERMRPALFSMTIPPLIGYYDGLFGPGTGSFFMLAFVALAGFGLLKATAHTKLLNLASNVGGLVLFAVAGAVYWKAGLLMGAAQFAGANLGSRVAMKGGARVIRPLLVIVCLALAAKLASDPAHPLRVWIGF